MKSDSVVLITGNWEKMVENLAEMLDGVHPTKKCAPTDLEVKRMVTNLTLYAIVVCLSEEKHETQRMQVVVEQAIAGRQLPVIVIGQQEDCDFFRQKMPISVLDAFARPLDTTAFMSALASCKESAESMVEEVSPLPARTVPTASSIPLPDAVPDIPHDMPPETEEMATTWQEAMLDAAYRDYLPPDEELSPIQRQQRKAAEGKLIKRIEHLSLLHGRKHVLVVDDDVRMLNIIKLYLQDLYDVTVVPTGRLAVKFLTQKEADVVLLDYLMPEMDGPDVLQKIRNETPRSTIPVLFLTGVADRNLVLRGLQFYPNGYLLKPVSRMTLLERVTELALGLN